MRFLNLPGAPVLLDRVGGRNDPAAGLRNTCITALDALLTDEIDEVLIIAPGRQTAAWSPGLSYPVERLIGGRIDGRIDGAQSLPLPLAIGRQLVGGRVGERKLIMRTVAVGHPGTAFDAGEDAAVIGEHGLVVAIADGSALGRPGGPDVVHPQAGAYDRSVLQAWQSGRPADLGALDAELGAEVMATGGAVWPELARLAAGRTYRSTISFADAPFGTFYLVAGWS